MSVRPFSSVHVRAVTGGTGSYLGVWGELSEERGAEKKAALRYLEEGGPLSEFALAVLLTNDFLYVN